MEPVGKYLHITESGTLEKSDQKTDKSDITDLARFVIQHRDTCTDAEVKKVHNLFYNRYKNTFLGKIRNFFYLLFHRSIRKALDKASMSLADLVEMVPDFQMLKKVDMQCAEAVKRFLEISKVKPTIAERLNKTLRQGTLAPVFSIMRRNKVYCQQHPEIIIHLAAFQGLILERKKKNEEWTWLPIKRDVSPEEKDSIPKHAFEYIVRTLDDGPELSVAQISRCFRELSKFLVCTDPSSSQNRQLYMKIQPHLEKIEAAVHKHTKTIQKRWKKRSQGRALPQDVADRIAELVSSGHLFIQAIDLLRARTQQAT